jgi:hypothetical protein
VCIIDLVLLVAVSMMFGEEYRLSPNCAVVSTLLLLPVSEFNLLPVSLFPPNTYFIGSFNVFTVTDRTVLQG